MAYLGRQPVIGNFVKLDAITTVNGQAAYTMQNGSVNFTDYSSVNQFLVSLNGTIQSPTSSFTVSGSTLTFASNLVTGDVIDFIIVFGNSLSAGVPTDATVTTAKLAGDAVTEAKIADGAVESEHLNANIISGQTELATTPADTDEFLISDAGVLKRLDYSHIKSSPKLELVVAGNSGSDFSLQNCFSSDYNIYYVHLYHGRPAVASSGSGLHMRFLGTSNTEITDSYNNSFAHAYFESSSNGVNCKGVFGGTFFDLQPSGHSATSHRSYTGTLIVYDPSNSTYSTNITYQGTSMNYGNTQWNSLSGGGTNLNTNYKVTTGLKFYQGSSTVSEMYYAIYGLKVS